MVMPAYLLPSGFILLRVSTAAILFIITSAIFIREKINLKQDLLKIIICAITGCGANMLLFFNGLSITTPINGAILMACTPVFVVVFANLLIREKLTWTRIAGISTACLGATMLLGGINFSFDAAHIWGDIMVAVNAIIYSFYLVYAKPLLKKYSPITLSAWTFGLGFFFVLPFGFQQLAHTNFSAIPANAWFYIIFILVGATFLTYLLNAVALRHASPALVGSYIYLQPVLAILIAILNKTDSISAEKIMYMLIIFAGVFMVSMKPKSVVKPGSSHRVNNPV
jgi:drug/metabolite transporter (DMT)-like permease